MSNTEKAKPPYRCPSDSKCTYPECGCEWHLGKEEKAKELEEAALRYTQDNFIPTTDWDNELMFKGFIAGAHWQSQQLDMRQWVSEQGWNKADEAGNVQVPDYLDPLINYVGTQLRFHTISGKNEVQTVVDIVHKAEQFFNSTTTSKTAYSEQEQESWTKSELMDEITTLQKQLRQFRNASLK